MLQIFYPFFKVRIKNLVLKKCVSNVAVKGGVVGHLLEPTADQRKSLPISDMALLPPTGMTDHSRDSYMGLLFL